MSGKTQVLQDIDSEVEAIAYAYALASSSEEEDEYEEDLEDLLDIREAITSNRYLLPRSVEKHDTDSLPPVSVSFGRDPHISSNRQKNRHLRSNASLIEVSLSSALTPQPERCCIARTSFHERFIFVALSVILLTVMCSSLGNTCSLTRLCHVICFPRSSSWFSSIHATKRSDSDFGHAPLC